MADTGSSRASGHDEADKDRLIEELREAVRARDEFVAIAAHELRNPMTPILAQVGLLLAATRNPSRCRPEIMAPRLQILEQAVQEFVRRSTTLLDVSRIAAGNIRIEPTEVDLSIVMRGIIDRATVGARLARCRIETDLQEDVVGMWDRLALEQTAENLLSNAIKFGAGKPIRASLRSDGQAAQLMVQDQGIGISEEDRARIFQRFERAVTRRDHGGFGIGLWLANQMVTAMGGSIDIESKSGHGSTFVVRLPLGTTRAGHE
ncbi:sensor histidine kinase [Geminicoccus flavidas]|uniref:sensor histidine kinase n=1 Tax=Geminicoccus flavidas TaxID=2506407 RepID=UPI00135C00DE|nr:HAMP domain-containing sensor histidine kinase [Geminicoccus flavidas]